MSLRSLIRSMLPASYFRWRRRRAAIAAQDAEAAEAIDSPGWLEQAVGRSAAMGFAASRSLLIKRLINGTPHPAKHIRVNYLAHWEGYPLHPMGDFAAAFIFDRDRKRMSALEDVLKEAYWPSGDKPSRIAIEVLRLLAADMPREIAVAVLLAYWQFLRGDLADALESARRIFWIDSRCLQAQWIMQQVYEELARRRAAGEDVDGISRPDEAALFEKDFQDCFCPVPFTELMTIPEGAVYTCCPGYVPVPIGNVFEDTWKGAWNSPAAQEVRRAILDGDFKYCNRRECPYFRAHNLSKRSHITDPYLRDIIDNRRVVLSAPPKMASLGHDRTCNLSCPQCRTSLIVAKGELIDSLKVANENFVLPLIEKVPHVTVTNSGDPFASRHYRQFLKEINPTTYPDIRKLTLLTNGELLNSKEWNNFSNLHYLDIEIVVSIDAACADTYAEIRRLGRFDRLMANLAFMAELRRQKKISMLSLRFAVQTRNFEEMPAFVRLAEANAVDAVVFTPLYNATTYSPEEFASRSVCDHAHPRHADLLRTVRDPVLRSPTVNFNALEYLLEEPGGTAEAAPAAHPIMG